jgi:hypothetical protein
MKIKVLMTLACLALAAPIVVTEARAADDSSNGTLPAPPPPADDNGGSSTNQCDPACVPPDYCCVLSGLESACMTKDDCGTKQQKLKKK